MWHFVLIFLSSCTFMMGSKNPESAKNSEYKVKFQSENWKEIKEDRSDYVWENVKDGRILLSNSFCKEFQDQPLHILATKTFNTVDDLKIEKKGYKTFHDREAYEVAGRGTVDGVPVGLILLNTRRNNCYFDFVSITPLESADEKHKEFEAFLNSVEFR